jgi:hypothetical protein
MRKLAAIAVLTLAVALAQPRSPLLLPSAQRVTGVVVDEDGKPVDGASIDHTGSRSLHRTDVNGRFDLSTDAPAFVIRKAGYSGLFLQTRSIAATGAPEGRYVLRGSPFRLSTCSRADIADDVYGYRISFEFPNVAEFRTASGRDIDYSVRSYYIDTTSGPKGIQHGEGPMWSFGIPVDDYVWKSAKYEDVSVQAGKITIVDARGQYANGDLWRFLGKFGETASYQDVDEKTGAVLDRVLDGVCLKVAEESIYK